LIFPWTGRRKSEPSNLRSRSEHALINSGLALVHLQAKSTAQSANREKPPKLASEPRRDQFSSGPELPNSGETRVFYADDERIQKTEDWLAEGVEFELSGDFLNGP
jgi:hypothetical protein